MDAKGLTANFAKTEVIKSGIGCGETESSGTWMHAVTQCTRRV